MMLPPEIGNDAYTAALPELREDLQFVGRTANNTGQPAWLVFDPLQHKYFRIDQKSFDYLSIWNSNATGGSLTASALEKFGHPPDEDHLQELTQFVQVNNLTADPAGGDWRALETRKLRRNSSWMSWIVHNYLFIRIPLVRPDRFLKATLPYVSPLFTWQALFLVFCLGVIGLYFASRQWDVFLTTFMDFFSLQGFAVYLVVLALIKILHELGHAYTATKFGCRVPTMGVAFLVLFPVLYTDATDAWKLPSRRKRLLIGAAGVIVELSLAALATFLWVFLPDGSLKSVAFVVATVSWTFSLLINLNPFLRFDGYYLMSDLAGIDNLQQRSFAVGRWAMREILFGLGEPAPERLKPGVRRFMWIYAWATWVYRFFLFIGIALLIYFMFFKLLAVVLFVIEIAWFIARPIWSELLVWWKMKNRILMNFRSWVTFAFVGCLAVLCILPISREVSIPAVVESEKLERIYATSPARLGQLNVTAGQVIEKGQVMFVLNSPKLDHEIELAGLRIEETKFKLARITMKQVANSQMQVLRKKLESLENSLAGLNDERDRLTITAAFDGRVVDLRSDLHQGRWVDTEKPMAALVAPGRQVARGYVSEADFERIETGNEGEFVPDDFQQNKLAVKVEALGATGVKSVDLPYLASNFGSGVAVRQTQQGDLAPVVAQYRIKLGLLDDAPAYARVTRGVVRLSARPESLAAGMWRQALKVLVRESGA